MNMTSSRELPLRFLREFIGLGYASYKLLPDDNAALERLYAEAGHYFAKDEAEKQKQRRGDSHVGYRNIGLEYSGSPDRPDLNESFTFWGGKRQLVPGNVDLPGFMDSLEEYTALAARVTGIVLREIRDYFGQREVVEFGDSSHIQVNCYQPMTADRELLQDLHEDGHLLTVHHADGPGFEVMHNGQAVSLPPVSGTLIIMPGSILTLMTGGLVEPLYHQVRRNSLCKRMSIMYFVNPSVTNPVKPYITNNSNRNVDIREQVIKNPEKYGLWKTQAYST